MTSHQHRTSGMGAFVISALYNLLALAWYDVQVLIHRVRQSRPVCILFGHDMPDQTVCVRVGCGTPYNRVRDCRRNS